MHGGHKYDILDVHVPSLQQGKQVSYHNYIYIYNRFERTHDFTHAHLSAPFVYSYRCCVLRPKECANGSLMRWGNESVSPLLRLLKDQASRGQSLVKTMDQAYDATFRLTTGKRGLGDQSATTAHLTLRKRLAERQGDTTSHGIGREHGRCSGPRLTSYPGQTYEFLVSGAAGGLVLGVNILIDIPSSSFFSGPPCCIPMLLAIDISGPVSTVCVAIISPCLLFMGCADSPSNTSLFPVSPLSANFRRSSVHEFSATDYNWDPPNIHHHFHGFYEHRLPLYLVSGIEARKLRSSGNVDGRGSQDREHQVVRLLHGVRFQPR